MSPEKVCLLEQSSNSDLAQAVNIIIKRSLIIICPLDNYQFVLNFLIYESYYN